MKILLLSDGQGWIVDRISQKYKEGTPHNIEVANYTDITPEDFISKANSSDIVHFNNTDIARLYPYLKLVQKPIIVSVRSFRYPMFFAGCYKEFAKIHAIHPDLADRFGGVYIPDGLFGGFEPSEFVVGMACQDGEWSKEYKGYYLVKEACENLGCTFKPVHDILPEEMPDYYKSLDLYVCASENEGFGYPVLECMSLNVPVITTDVGIAKDLNLVKCKRTVESVEKEISKFYTSPQVAHLTWENTCKDLSNLYESLGTS